jgi:hypothetical protein
MRQVVGKPQTTSRREVVCGLPAYCLSSPSVIPAQAGITFRFYLVFAASTTRRASAYFVVKLNREVHKGFHAKKKQMFSPREQCI